jgi:hypothetical protein
LLITALQILGLTYRGPFREPETSVKIAAMLHVAQQAFIKSKPDEKAIFKSQSHLSSPQLSHQNLLLSLAPGHIAAQSITKSLKFFNTTFSFQFHSIFIVPQFKTNPEAPEAARYFSLLFSDARG